MGVHISFPNVRDGNLVFPPEVLELIISHLSIRDKLVARQVCPEWRDFIDCEQSSFVEKVVVKMEHSEEPVRFLEQSDLGMIWTSFQFKSVEFTRHSLSFWSSFGDQLTWIDFFDCTFPQNFFCPPTNQPSQRHCVNLKHLGLRNCSKYLMMGKIYFHLHKFFDLKNLEVLDLSQNTYLNDYALLMLATSCEHLRSINLRLTNMSFTQAVFNRFYPRDKIFNNYTFRGEFPGENFKDFSDNILTFHMLHFAYLSTPLAKHMEELIFDDTRVDIKALRLIVDPGRYSWKSISLNKCMEMKQGDFIELISSQKSIEKLELGCSKIDISQLGEATSCISNLKHLVIRGCGEIKKTEFLLALPKLVCLDVSSCACLELNAQDFRQCRKLEILRMRGITPFYAMNYDNSEKATVLRNIIMTVPLLTELDIGDCGSALTDTVMQAVIQYLPRLKVLRVCQSKITDRGLAGVEIDDTDARSSTRTASKRRSDITDRNNSSPPGLCLSNLSGLRTLSLSKCHGLSEASWKLALRLPSLQHLDLSLCWQISVTGFSSIIMQCPNLETLNIVSCGMHITGNPELLDLARTQLVRLRQLQV